MIDNNFYQNLSSALSEYFKKMNFRPLMPDIEAILVFGIHEQFETEGAYFNGKKWAPLADSTIKQRQKKGKWPGSILQQTGGLASSISSSTSGNMELSIGTSRSYAEHLHYGTSKMQARPILPSILPNELLEEIAFVISDYLT